MLNTDKQVPIFTLCFQKLACNGSREYVEEPALGERHRGLILPRSLHPLTGVSDSNVFATSTVIPVHKNSSSTRPFVAFESQCLSSSWRENRSRPRSVCGTTRTRFFFVRRYSRASQSTNLIALLCIPAFSLRVLLSMCFLAR